jgi:hypothetical protein
LGLFSLSLLIEVSMQYLVVLFCCSNGVVRNEAVLYVVDVEDVAESQGSNAPRLSGAFSRPPVISMGLSNTKCRGYRPASRWSI